MNIFFKITYQRYKKSCQNFLKSNQNWLMGLALWIGVFWFALNVVFFLKELINYDSISLIGLFWLEFNILIGGLVLYRYVKESVKFKTILRPDEFQNYRYKNNDIIDVVLILFGISGVFLTIMIVNVGYGFIYFIKKLSHIPSQMIEKNKNFFDSHPQEASKILKSSLPKAKKRKFLVRL